MTRQVETRTKIVATLGPASWDRLDELIGAGVDVFRVNCSHADHASIRRQVASVRAACARAGRPVGLLLDLQGPKIRVGPLEEPRELLTGALLTVRMSDEDPGEPGIVGTTYPAMADDVSVGDTVLFDDGELSGTVEDVSPREVRVRMTRGGTLRAHKGINLPGVTVSAPSLTPKDRADLAVGVEAGVDFVALSFVRRPEDVAELEGELAKLGVPDMPVIAKIEKPEAMEHIDAIVAEAAGVMVARGDLGVEVSLEKVPVYQKRIIAAAFHAGKMCITATQMLDSMRHAPRPTRAETTDVANAILDGTDAVMLSGETAVGEFPVESVRTMDRIAREVESSAFFATTDPQEMPAWPGARGVVTRAACWAVNEELRPLVVVTWSGGSAVFVSKARPRGPIYALSPDARVVHRLALVWGVTPLLLPPVHTVDDVLNAGERVLRDHDHVAVGDDVVFLVGRSPLRRVANLLRIMRIRGEDPASVRSAR